MTTIVKRYQKIIFQVRILYENVNLLKIDFSMRFFNNQEITKIFLVTFLQHVQSQLIFFFLLMKNYRINKSIFQNTECTLKILSIKNMTTKN